MPKIKIEIELIESNHYQGKPEKENVIFSGKLNKKENIRLSFDMQYPFISAKIFNKYYSFNVLDIFAEIARVKAKKSNIVIPNNDIVDRLLKNKGNN